MAREVESLFSFPTPPNGKRYPLTPSLWAMLLPSSRCTRMAADLCSSCLFILTPTGSQSTSTLYPKHLLLFSRSFQIQFSYFWQGTSTSHQLVHWSEDRTGMNSSKRPYTKCVKYLSYRSFRPPRWKPLGPE